MTKQSLAQILTYAGTLPFLGASIGSFVVPLDTYFNFTQVILAYGAVIVSFIAGSHWGMYMLKDIKLNLLLHSNIAALLAWLAVLLPTPFANLLLVLCFGYLLIIDTYLLKDHITEPWYFRMRLIASCIVVLALGLHALSI